MAFETRYMIEWGDCDEAGIVFYPNYFYWFDCTWQRWLRSVGMSQRELRNRWGAITPLIDVGASFRGPATYDEEIVLRGRIEDWTDRRFRCVYAIECAGKVVVEGHELRAWATRDPAGKLRGAVIEPEFRKLME